jgi:arylsulfatase A-like enzyme/Tfp pilus assembly protein PilF
VFRLKRKTSKSTSRVLTPARVAAVLVLISAVAAAIVWFRPAHKRQPLDLQRVLLISIDTCRADRLNCYGHPRPTTPHIDAVASEGSLFINAIAPVPMTLPSHSTMLTGTIPPYHGVHDNLMYGLGQDNITLAEILKEQGFITGAIVGAFVLDAQFGLDRGFDTYDDRFESYDSSMKLTQRRASDVSRLAIEWLEQHQDNKFFLFAHYYDPHAPYDPPDPFASRFSDDPYDGEIAYTDECVGRVIKKLKDLGLYDSTLIVITADHGELLGEHGEPTHSFFIYQNALRVPFIVKLPESPDTGSAGQQNEPRKIDSVVGLVDIVPTICGLMGIESPAAVRGVDLTDALFGESVTEVDRQVYCESLTPTKYNANSLLGLVTKRWKYIQTTRPELYNLESDPSEELNLAAAEVETAQLLRDQLEEVLDDQVRRLEDSKIAPGADAIRQLESLGYVGGAVSEDLSFDQSKCDPKDAIKLHHDHSKLMALIAEKQYERASRLSAEIVRDHPEYVMVHIHMARIAMDQNDMAQAVVHLEQALEISPDDTDTHHYMGLALVDLGRTDEAIDHYEQALATRPDAAAETHTALGLALVSQGKLDEAIKHHREALRENPKLANAHNNLATALSGQGKLAESIGHLREALRYNPEYAEAHYNLANAVYQQGQREEAVRLYRMALAIKPDLVEAHYNLAMVMAKQGNPQEAVHHYRQAIRFQPDLSPALNNLANLLASQGQMEEAIQNYERALKANPKYALAHIGLGGVLRVEGQLDRALVHFRKAQQLMPEQPRALSGLAWILATSPDEGVRRPEEATRLARRAAELTQRRDPAVLDTLAASLAAAGRFDQAEKTAQAALDLAKSAGNLELAQQIELRLEGYRRERPYVDRKSES